ncbi:response regulator [Candidatus Omnitrophota bacterium]
MPTEKILIIDDDKRIIQSIKLVLNEYDIIGITNPSEGLTYLKKTPDIDLVLLDIYMDGEAKGLKILNEIKEIDPAIIVIIMTAYGNMDVAIEALRSHADDFIEKPYDIKNLKNKVAALLKTRKMPRDDSKNKDKKLKRIKQFIERNYQDVSLESISNEICLSGKYLSRFFNKHNSTNFRNYKMKVKIDTAKQLLSGTSLTVKEISHKLGYQNPESFMRAFKHNENKTPKEYRISCNHTKPSTDQKSFQKKKNDLS